VQDITQRKRSEDELRESEAGLAAAQRIAHIGSWHWDVQTDTARWSDETFRIFGLTPRQLEEHRKSFLDMIHPEDKARVDRALMEAVNGTGKYDLDYRIQLPDGTVKMIHAQAETLNDEAGRPLRMQGTIQDITERKRMEKDLQSSLDQLRALAARLQSIREEERTRVARDIHDQLGQALTAIKLDMSSLVRELPAGVAQQSKRASSILQLVDESIQAVRRISTELRPGILDDLGLVAAIEWAGEDFQARTGTTCGLDLPQEVIAVDPEQATAIFRIFQETMTNVARHAHASKVEVRLAREDGDLTLEVHDDGKGMPEDKLMNIESLGILGMRGRAMLLGGELTISSPPGKGTTVRVRIPEAHRT
jgi:PAS domain S-box-containing protein